MEIIYIHLYHMFLKNRYVNPKNGWINLNRKIMAIYELK